MALTKSAQQKTAFAFGTLFVAVFLLIAFFIPNPTDFQYTIFRIILALAAAGVAAMIPGFISVEVGNAVKAGGAIAVFVIVFFFSPAAIMRTDPPPAPNGTDDEPESPKITATLSLRDDLCSWYLAESDFLDRVPSMEKTIPSYYGGSDAEVLVPGLWRGDITRGLQDPLAKMQLQRSLFRIIPQLAEAKAKYFNGANRTETLDNAWNLIPDERVRNKDLEAFSAFARVLYPDPVELHDKKNHLTNRDELIASLREHWVLPEEALQRSSSSDAELRLFYDLLLWRTSPVLSIRVTNAGRVKQPFDAVELICEQYEPLKDTMVSGPIDVIANVKFVLDGNNTPKQSQRINAAVAPGDVADILVRVESTRKAAYRVRLILRNAETAVWESSRINLFFTY